MNDGKVLVRVDRFMDGPEPDILRYLYLFVFHEDLQLRMPVKTACCDDSGIIRGDITTGNWENKGGRKHEDNECSDCDEE